MGIGLIYGIVLAVIGSELPLEYSTTDAYPFIVGLCTLILPPYLLVC